MNKQERPLGITALAFVSVMVGLYCQIAAIALLLGAMLGGVFGSDLTGVVIIMGALNLGLMAAAYFLGYGFWTQRHWSWAGGIVVFSTLIVTSILLMLVSTNVLSALVPSLGAAAAIWYLFRPATKALLLGADPTDQADKADTADRAETPARPVTLDVPQVVR
jgi:K+ transporter